MLGRVLWSVNSTSTGGGVAEMLRSLLGYVRGAGIDARWVVITGSREFFLTTKRIHNALHGESREPRGLGDYERSLYLETTLRNAVEMAAVLRPGDVVMLHDPQTAGLVPHLAQLGVHVIWRCHIGHDQSDAGVEAAWDFLAPLLADAEVLIFTRQQYVPHQLASRPRLIIPPSIDPFSAKNQELSVEAVRSILHHTGLLENGNISSEQAAFVRQDGSPGRIDRAADVIRLGPAPCIDDPLVVQVSRWDRLKDPVGVLNGFARSEFLLSQTRTQLILAGPNVNAVADDPDGAAVFGAVLDAWRALPHHQRRRVHLANLPMADVEENAAIVNALQRHATVVVQKSLHEGFGLTVAEAMWKYRPVVASAVGGIPDQIDDGVSGILLHEPTNLDAFALALEQLIADPARAREFGRAAHLSVRERFLGLQTLLRYGYLLEQMLEREDVANAHARRDPGDLGRRRLKPTPHP